MLRHSVDCREEEVSQRHFMAINLKSNQLIKRLNQRKKCARLIMQSIYNLDLDPLLKNISLVLSDIRRK